MSEYNDVLYDPRTHTHTSCVDEVVNCDVVVLILGSRFGGTAVPQAKESIDFAYINKQSVSKEALGVEASTSVTQLEVLKAVEQGIPVYAFIEQQVSYDHLVYEKNKHHSKDVIERLYFPSIAKQDTAKFIFEFINFLRHRVLNNSIFTFSRIQDIEDGLRRQWSGLLQRLINENRSKTAQSQLKEELLSQFADLRTAVLSSIESKDTRRIAKAVVRFRRLVSFLRGLGLGSAEYVASSRYPTLNSLLDAAGVDKVVAGSTLTDDVEFSHDTLLVKKDGTFFTFFDTGKELMRLENEWQQFIKIPPKDREIVMEAFTDVSEPTGVRYYDFPISNLLKNKKDKIYKAPT
jgi:hypothetical protein